MKFSDAILIALIVLVLVIVIIKFFYKNPNRYVPTITVSVSTNGGKTYDCNLKSIPRNRDIYLKYEISVKANGLWWRFFCSTVKFDLKFPEGFELYDYPRETKAPEQELDSQKKSFLVAASNKPKKAEIILKLSSQENTKDVMKDGNCKLTLSFHCPVHNVYNRTITLGFNKEQINTEKINTEKPNVSRIDITGNIELCRF
ncbi:MAG: hypothetical protein LBP29_06380 [Treponema sp.]|jgi:hypothetical protein|nr:hypothetical protein [Treponema sp.]